MCVKRSKLFQSLVFKCNKIQQLLTKPIKIKPPRLPPLLLCSSADFESPPGPFRKQLRSCRLGLGTSSMPTLPSIPPHRGWEQRQTQFPHPQREVMMGRRSGDWSQRIGLIRAQLGYRAPREGLCNTRSCAGSDLRCPWVWLPPAQLSGEVPSQGAGTLSASPFHHHHPRGSLAQGHYLLLSYPLPQQGHEVFTEKKDSVISGSQEPRVNTLLPPKRHRDTFKNEQSVQEARPKSIPQPKLPPRSAHSCPVCFLNHSAKNNQKFSPVAGLWHTGIHPCSQTTILQQKGF